MMDAMLPLKYRKFPLKESSLHSWKFTHNAIFSLGSIPNSHSLYSFDVKGKPAVGAERVSFGGGANPALGNFLYFG